MSFGDNLGMTAPADVELLRRELQREQERLHALRDVSVAVGRTLDLNELFDVVLGRVALLLGAERATVYVFDEDAGQLWARVPDGPRFMEIRLSPGEGIAGSVAETGTLVNIPDAYADPRFDRSWDEKSGFRTRSVLCAPLMNQNGRIVGVLQALNKTGRPFDGEDEGLIKALGAQIAVAIENSKLFLSVVGKNMELLEAKEQLETKVRELDVLFDIAKVSATSMVMEDMLSGVLRRSIRAVGASAAAILIEGNPSGELRFCPAEPANAPVRVIRVGRGEGLSGWVAQHGMPQKLADVQGDPRFSRNVANKLGFSPRSALSVPLQWDDGVGALTLFDKARGRDAFDDGDVKLVSVIAGYVSTAVGLAQARVRRAQEERLSTIGQFMSGVLHDLKTPMTVIHGYVQLMAEESDAAKRQRFAEVVQQQVGFIRAMTQETLAFARGDRKLWVRKVYLQQFFEDLGTQLARQFDGKPVAFSLDLEDRGVAHFDATKVERAIHNLARNAMEALGPAGGRVRLSVSRGADDGALRIAVTDNGPGIPEEIRDRLFHSFATHGKSHGTGLGLAIVKSIVDDHGGTVHVASRPGETTFTLTLPDLAETTAEGAASGA